MCGILGSINLKINQVSLDTIFHRGPDSGAIEEFNIQGNKVYFGHRRLAIVDLTETGHQPMFTSDSKFAIIFNGEIYNHLELREKLPSIDFRGTSDTETILYYLAAFGIEAVIDFNGVFSIGFLDIEREKLYLIRDPFGVKPLYYGVEHNTLVFSSEIRPIHHLYGDLSLDKGNIAELLKLRYNPAPDTIYKEIKKLKPGHILECDITSSINKIEISSYIKRVNISRDYSFNKAVTKYGELFESAVKRQLMSDVEIGSLLSGGIDSALVTYFAQKHLSSKIKTYTVGFEDIGFANELSDAQITADFLKTDHRSICISSQNFKSVFEETCKIVEEPIGTTSILPMYYLNEAVSKELKVVLTGQGADEPLGGYTRYQGEMMANKYPAFLFDLMKPIAKLSKKERWIRASQSLSIANPVSRWENIYALFTDKEIMSLMNIKDVQSKERIQYFYDLLDCKNKKGVEGMMAVDMRMNLADDLLMYTDKVSMNFTIETRVPMLDIELIKFLESLPVDYKIQNGQTKRIHKAFAEEILPKEIINRPKKGFLSPTEKWFREDLGDYYVDLLNNNNKSGYFDVFDKNAVLNVFKEHKAGYNREKQIFTLLSLYYLIK
ncbi:asparagine synthase (glutamine-hydrolyzing) [Myroides guanonis]|uniref:asparagine synthase (glutamine-hydrolyzing) n=1 Tax=Myroides guanonis TaxID=1150112 RepID=A0A1I3RM64_9FLAO|nr:asparagine synthase (glutamine-hydrolyzing) [Myroides guanonis]SFJ46859.1 asparagine synthase (glutamine-hydrolysing) [Myroides guanonis]